MRSTHPHIYPRPSHLSSFFSGLISTTLVSLIGGDRIVGMSPLKLLIILE
jgi:hypothetical protein